MDNKRPRHLQKKVIDSTLSYFVGDPAYPQDKGFALKGWTKCESQNAGIFITGDFATSMGNVMVTNKDGKVTTVDKTWAYTKDDAGKLRIVVHHSSLPYYWQIIGKLSEPLH